MTDRAERIRALGFDPATREQKPVLACNLCGSLHHVEAARTDRYGYLVTYNVCARCGLGFLSPRLAAAEYADFYEKTYRPLVSAYHGRRIDAETVQVEQRAYGEDLARFLGRTLPRPPQTILDVGGSTGTVADAVCAGIGGEATVLDPAPEELTVAAAAGMEIVAGFAEDADLEDRTFDLVLLCQMIDHLLDANATLAAIRRWVAAGGHLFVDVLDVGFVARKLGSIESAVKIDHPYYFTRDTAVAYLQRTGFEVTAERLADDGHWGFLATPAATREPDWDRLSAAAGRHLAEIWTLRARG